MTDTIQERLKCEGWCHDPVRQPSCAGHFLDCNACVEFKRRAAHIDAQDAKIKALVDALEAIDEDLEGRNFLEDSSLRDKTRAALAAAKETT